MYSEVYQWHINLLVNQKIYVTVWQNTILDGSCWQHFPSPILKGSGIDICDRLETRSEKGDINWWLDGGRTESSQYALWTISMWSSMAKSWSNKNLELDCSILLMKVIRVGITEKKSRIYETKLHDGQAWIVMSRNSWKDVIYVNMSEESLHLNRWCQQSYRIDSGKNQDRSDGCGRR